MTDSPLDIAILIEDPLLQRIVVTWPKITDWQNPNLDRLAQETNVPRSQIESVLQRARTHNLIRPDGTINSFAEKYLTGLIAQKLKQIQKVK